MKTKRETVLELADQGFTNKAIAEKLGCSVGSVRVAKARGKKLLKKTRKYTRRKPTFTEVALTTDTPRTISGPSYDDVVVLIGKVAEISGILRGLRNADR